METIALGPVEGLAAEDPAPVVSRAVNARGRATAAAVSRRVGLAAGLNMALVRNPVMTALLRKASPRRSS
ncbi:hypothetical protein NLX86_14215 [Streptomyces sp. A3M-1-3]|uniref:hypothetical protein n=1 Tax=Streptomyces sp. A3M-1-3 TaxID=2962044 RepID=UPI0020B7EC00|nr:hypothetical protein [Streptomyces sp. A3M-1-3]MCP3819220.1 hypothetical protein [Streptomyces sp. A3M-1-3]